MKPSDFIHPEDAAALRQMENIPGFAALVKKILAIGWGLVELSKFDNRALDVAERACACRPSAFAADSQPTSDGAKFCQECGHKF